MRKRLLLSAVTVVLLQGCATLDSPSTHTIMASTSYDAVLKDYKSGRILQARRKILHMRHNRPDYQRSKKLLTNKIEPARRRLLKYYSQKARSAVSHKQWVDAERFYKQAVEFSLGDSRLKRKKQAISLKISQIRLSKLIRQRRKEDKILLRWMHAYEVPIGLEPRDEPFIRMLRERQHQINIRVNLSLTEAHRYLSKGYPEVAYVEIESYLFFRPKSKMGRKFREEIKKALPKGINTHPLRRNVHRRTIHHAVKHSHAKKAPAPQQVKASDIEELIKQGNLTEALQSSIAYYNSGGANAEQYLRRLEKARQSAAKAYFKRGKLAFQNENLDRAVELWSKAVKFAPDHDEYAASLQRAEQLQERLNVLRQNN